MANIAFEINNLNYFYNKFNKFKLNNINININKGEMVSLIGPNGCGKTTFIKIISSIIKPISGKVFLYDRNIFKLKQIEIAKMVSVVSQNFNTELSIKVDEFILFGRYPYINKLKFKIFDYDKDIVTNIMKTLNIYKLKDKYLDQLSYGQRQLIVIAKTLAQETPIILLDEPVSHLDIKNQTFILDIIKSINIKKKVTIITVLHDINMAINYSNRIIMIKNGEIYNEFSTKNIEKNTISNLFNF